MQDEDKRMLEMAAMAGGYQYMPANGCIVVDGIPGRWNPLADDGDALRLAVKLDIEVEPVPFGGRAIVRDDDDYGEQFDEESSDRMAATRRAIVRAAAAIGEKMP